MMNKGKELTTQQNAVGFAIPPDIVLQNAMVAAKALKDVISKKDKPVIINGEQYLEYEDLQTVGQFYGYTVKTGEAVFIEIDGVKGAKAHADLVDFKTGEIIGGAEAYCMRDEERWGTRPKYEWQGEGDNRKRIKIGDEIVPWFQLASMAQTRAGAKAFRNRLAWVVVLAGYKPTPAEEMTENTVSENVKERRTVDKTAHYCPVHNVNFFKKGRMKGYAHPIEGTDEWCNEPTEDDKKPPTIITPEGNRPMTGKDREAMREIVAKKEQALRDSEALYSDRGGTTPIASQSPQNEQGTALKPEVVETITAPARPVVEHTRCKNIGDFLNCCFKEFGLVKGKAIKEAGYARQEDISDAEQAYQNVKAGQEKAP